MAFTAGSPELAKANSLGARLASLKKAFGSGFLGVTAAPAIEKAAKRYGFSITGITTGAGFPPFGSFYPTGSTGFQVSAALQNPRGETMASGVTLAENTGLTVGIYLKKFVRSGEDYRAVVVRGLTLGATLNSGAVGVSAFGTYTVFHRDILNFGDGRIAVVANGNVLATGIGGGGSTSSAGGSGNIVLSNPVNFTIPIGTPFNVESVGITRGTVGVAGSTFESFRSNTNPNRGFTATVYYDWSASAGSTWSVQ